MSRNPVYIKLINSQRWRDLRNRKLQEHPLCEVCESEDRSTLATEVHHRIPVESVASEVQMRALMFNYANLMSVCHGCHAEIHRRMFSHSKAAIKANTERATKRFIDKFFNR